MTSPLPLGSTIGIVGGGQLGRMLSIAAARLGYRTIVLEPQEDCPAAQTANEQLVAPYDDADALEALAKDCAVVTYEFENVPVEAAIALNAKVPVFPPPAALEAAQDRVTEKTTLNAMGIATAKFVKVDSDEDLIAGLEALAATASSRPAASVMTARVSAYSATRPPRTRRTPMWRWDRCH